MSKKKILRLQNNVDFIIFYVSFVRIVKTINKRFVQKNKMKNIKFIRVVIDFLQKAMKMFMIFFFQNLFIVYTIMQN